MEKYFKLVPGNRSRVFTFYLPFILLPAEIDVVPQKKGCKRNLVWFDSSAGGKVVFTLLAKF